MHIYASDSRISLNFLCLYLKTFCTQRLSLGFVIKNNIITSQVITELVKFCWFTLKKIGVTLLYGHKEVDFFPHCKVKVSSCIYWDADTIPAMLEWCLLNLFYKLFADLLQLFLYWEAEERKCFRRLSLWSCTWKMSNTMQTFTFISDLFLFCCCFYIYGCYSNYCGSSQVCFLDVREHLS